MFQASRKIMSCKDRIYWKSKPLQKNSLERGKSRTYKEISTGHVKEYATQNDL